MFAVMHDTYGTLFYHTERDNARVYFEQYSCRTYAKQELWVKTKTH